MSSEETKSIIESLEKHSSLNARILVSFIVAIAYIFISVATTTDIKLLISDSSLRLPVLNIDVSIKYFFFFAPPLVLILHAILLSSLEGYLEEVMSVKEHNNDFDIYREAPNLLNRLISSKFKHTSGTARGTRLLFWLITYAAPLFVLIFIQWKYSKNHDTRASFYHFFIVLCDIIILFRYRIKVDSILKTDKAFSMSSIILNTGPLIFALLSSCAQVLFIWLFLDHYADKYYHLISGWRPLIPHITLPKTPETTRLLKEGKLILSGRDLRFADLSEQNLSDADFAGARLKGANLQKANLIDAQLKGAFLDGADLKETDLRHANLMDARLLNANLDHASLWATNLFNANLKGANLPKANLHAALLTGAQLQGAILWGAELRYADLRGAKLKGSSLRGANLIGAIMQETQLQGADLADANLCGADLRKANLEGSYLSHARLAAVDVRGAILDKMIAEDIKWDMPNETEQKEWAEPAIEVKSFPTEHQEAILKVCEQIKDRIHSSRDRIMELDNLLNLNDLKYYDLIRKIDDLVDTLRNTLNHFNSLKGDCKILKEILGKICAPSCGHESKGVDFLDRRSRETAIAWSARISVPWSPPWAVVPTEVHPEVNRTPTDSGADAEMRELLRDVSKVLDKIDKIRDDISHRSDPPPLSPAASPAGDVTEGTCDQESIRARFRKAVLSGKLLMNGKINSALSLKSPKQYDLSTDKEAAQIKNKILESSQVLTASYGKFQSRYEKTRKKLLKHLEEARSCLTCIDKINREKTTDTMQDGGSGISKDKMDQQKNEGIKLANELGKCIEEIEELDFEHHFAAKLKGFLESLQLELDRLRSAQVSEVIDKIGIIMVSDKDWEKLLNSVNQNHPEKKIFLVRSPGDDQIYTIGSDRTKDLAMDMSFLENLSYARREMLRQAIYKAKSRTASFEMDSSSENKDPDLFINYRSKLACTEDVFVSRGMIVQYIKDNLLYENVKARMKDYMKQNCPDRLEHLENPTPWLFR